MSVYQIAISIKKWIGESTDTKPTSSVPEGSVFHEIDTGMEFLYHDSAWRQDLRLWAASQTVQAIPSWSESPSASPSLSPSNSPSLSPSESPSESPSTSPSGA